MTKDKLTALAERCQKAEKEDQDNLLELAFNFCDPEPNCDWKSWSSERLSKQDQSDKIVFSAWLERDERRKHFNDLRKLKAYESAALMLLPEGCFWAVGSDGSASVFRSSGAMYKGAAATPALALTAACLLARAEEMG
jgi:hypothetical protein